MHEVNHPEQNSPPSPHSLGQFSETACDYATSVPDSDAATDSEILCSVPERFAVTDKATANWLVRKIVEARRYARSVKEWAEQEQHRAEREEKSLLHLFGSQIEAWAKCEVVKLNGRRKSVSLPAGTLSFRRENSKLVIVDEKAVLEWARKACPAAIEISEKLSRSAFKAHVEATGELPDTGVYSEPAKEAFRIS